MGPSVPVTVNDMEMVPVDLEGQLLAVATDPGDIQPKHTTLVQGDYFEMNDGEPPGSRGGADSDEPVFVPHESQVVEAHGESPADDGDDNDDGPRVIVLPPKDLTSKQLSTWQTTLAILKEEPKLRAPPAALKRKWSPAQVKVWHLVKLAIKKERKRLYHASERKRKALATTKKTQAGHEEEPEFMAAS